MTPRWSAVIVDDEPPARRALRVLLARYPAFEVVGEADHVAAAIGLVRERRPDVVFLDVRMPGADGFELVAAVGKDAVPALVVTTAFADHALEAFEARALDYLLKPFSDERFADVMSRVIAHLGRRAPRGPRALTVRDRGRTLVIPVSEIDWIEAQDYCTRIHAGTRRPVIRRTLQSLAKELAPAGFVRVHRSSIVNVRQVREVRPLPTGDAEAVLAAGAVVRVSRSCRGSLQTTVASLQSAAAGG